MRVVVKDKEFSIDKNFFLNDSLGIVIVALSTTILFGKLIGTSITIALFLRLIKEEFKKWGLY